jgi:hypothetical protein
MNNYTIILQGRGSEFNVHDITPDQREKLEHLNLKECILDDVADILEMKTNDQLISSERVFLGAIPENSEITVFDENGGTVYKELVQDILFQEHHNPDSVMSELYQTEKLYVEDTVKGILFQIEIKDSSFDISKLKINITDIEGHDYVTSLKYNDVENSFGDYWSKGIQFFLSNE